MHGSQLDVQGMKLSALSTKHNKSRFRVKVTGQCGDREICGVSFPVLCVSKITVASGGKKSGSRKSGRDSEGEGDDVEEPEEEEKRKRPKHSQAKQSVAEELIMEISQLQMQSQAQLRRLEDFTDLLKNHKVGTEDVAARKQVTLEASLRDLVESYGRIVGEESEKKDRIQRLADTLPTRVPLRRIREFLRDLQARSKKEPQARISEGIVPAQQMTLFNDQFVLLNDVTPFSFEQRNIDESQPGGDWFLMDFEEDVFGSAGSRGLLGASLGDIPLLSSQQQQEQTSVAVAPPVPPNLHSQEDAVIHECNCPSLCEYKWEYTTRLHQEAALLPALKKKKGK